MYEHLLAISRIQKTHGKRGEIVAHPCDGLPPLLNVGMRVCIVPPPLRGPRWHEVARVTNEGSGSLVQLKGVTDIDTASKLVGKTILALVDDLPDDVGLMRADALVGIAVVDEHAGMLGTIREVMRTPAQDIVVVEGEPGETMIPLVDEFVVDFDDDKSTLAVSVPDGLIGGAS